MLQIPETVGARLFFKYKIYVNESLTYTANSRCSSFQLLLVLTFWSRCPQPTYYLTCFSSINSCFLAQLTDHFSVVHLVLPLVPHPFNILSERGTYIQSETWSIPTGACIIILDMPASYIYIDALNIVQAWMIASVNLIFNYYIKMDGSTWVDLFLETR